MRARTTSTPSSSGAPKPVFPPSALPERLSLAIERIGHSGDGLAQSVGGRFVSVPYTLPGETVLVTLTGRRAGVDIGRADSWISSSADRVEPPCLHFGNCGGCALQHWSDDAYRAWKSGRLSEALRGAGYAAPSVLPIIPAAPRERRRVALAFQREGNTVKLGLHQAGNRLHVIDIADCVVLHPDLERLLQPLRTLLTRLPLIGGSGSVVINLLHTGPDIVVRAPRMPDRSGRALLVEFARTNKAAGLHWARGKDAPEPICLLDRAEAKFAGFEVAVPPEAFLQATQSGENAITAAVLAGLPKALPATTKVVELYAGCGTLTFPLARHARITAYEGSIVALSALRNAVSQVFPGRVQCHHRDLNRQPLTATELSGFAIAVLDPPWAGANRQIREIARSTLTRVIYVSCNAAALRNDAAILREAGFDLTAATPIDQFLWSSQLEAVAIFTR